MPKSLETLRVLLDECLPKKLKSEFAGCIVWTVVEKGWSGKKNGELMALAAPEFDVFVTADQNLRFQQNLAYAEIGVLVLMASNTRVETLSPLLPQVNRALASVEAGRILEIRLESEN